MANGRGFLDVPTGRGLVVAGIGVLVFGAIAYGLYTGNGKTGADFWIKVADFLLQGALVTLLFAILKGLIDSVRVSSR